MTRPIFATPLEALRYHVTGKIERGEAAAIVGIEERRQSTPEYRERVHRYALWYVRQADGDYDTALDNVAYDIANTTPADWPHLPDVATLLRRRADTVKGLRNA